MPVAHNAGYFWPRRGVLKKRGTIRVIIGPPIEAAGRDVREVNDEVQAWIEAQQQTCRRDIALTRLRAGWREIRPPPSSRRRHAH